MMVGGSKLPQAEVVSKSPQAEVVEEAWSLLQQK